MHSLAPLVYDLAMMLGLASVVTLIFQRIHQPVVLGYLVAGIIIGPYAVPFLTVTDKTSVQTLSEMGVIFLMFSLGLEFSFQKLTQVGFSATVTGIVEVLLMTAIGFLAGFALGWPHYDAIFLGAALAISSTTIIIKAIDELGLKTKRFAELIFGVLIVEDLVAILLLVALSTMVYTDNLFSFDMLKAAAKLIIVVGGWFLVGYFIMPPLFLRVAGYISEETLTILSVALCLILVCIAAQFHYTAALGAFIMGSILAETILVHRIETLVRPIRDICAAIFFISVGMLIDPAEIIKNWKIILLLTSVTILGKIISTFLAALLTGQRFTTSLRIGFGMAQIGEFSFIIIGLGLSLGVINRELYSLVVAVSGITTFTTPYFIRLSGPLGHYLLKHMPEKMQLFLDRYALFIHRLLATLQKNPAFRVAIVRFIINALIVVMIFSLVRYFLYRYVATFLQAPWLMTLVGLVAAILFSMAFIWGMMFSFRDVKMSHAAKLYLHPINYMIWLFAFLEVVILGMIYFHSLMIIFIFDIFIALLFALIYKKMEKAYLWFERSLVGNIRKADNKRQRYRALAPWNTCLVELTVDEFSAFVGKTLKMCAVRERYGVNIVAICHGDRILPAPRGEEKFMPHDNLIVLGKQSQIERFKHALMQKSQIKNKPGWLSNFTLKSMHIRADSIWVDASIRDSRIRETIGGLVVGLERHQHRQLNPDPDTIILPDDLLLIVGEKSKIDKII